MTASTQSRDTTPLPSITHSSAFTTPSYPPSHGPSSTNSSDPENVDIDSSAIVAPRPRISSRKISGTNIVPRDHPDIEIKEESFPPHDARAMSPRRTSAEMEKIGAETRKTLERYILLSPYSHLRRDEENLPKPPADFLFRHAMTLQSGLSALAEKIEVVKLDHDKLEKQNVALQDYIGGLTKSMSRTDLTTKSKK